MTHVGQSRESQRNLRFGLDTRTWGFPEWKPEYRGARPDFVVLGTGASPRVPLERWLVDSATLYLFEARGGFYQGRAPHWPDEDAENRVKYFARLGIEPLAVLRDVPLAATGPLGEQASDALRRSGTDRGLGKLVRLDPRALLSLAGIDTPWRPETPIPLAAAPGITLDEATAEDEADGPRRRRRRGTGRISDPLKRKAIEEHAVALARAHYEERGWDVEEIGKPYDLRCTKRDEERRVEVKGTTGAAVSVELTVNEVEHARDRAHTVDLFVVSDIVVDATIPGYPTSGGTVHHHLDWTPADRDLRPTRYEYRLPTT